MRPIYFDSPDTASVGQSGYRGRTLVSSTRKRLRGPVGVHFSGMGVSRQLDAEQPTFRSAHDPSDAPEHSATRAIFGVNVHAPVERHIVYMLDDMLDGRRKPTMEELATFVRVREYLRWHEAGPEELSESDHLFKAGVTTVEFGSQEGLSPWNLYVAGYFQAARALLEGPCNKFFLLFAIYPVVFLYRHYLELEVKGIMIAAARVLKTPLPDFGKRA